MTEEQYDRILNNYKKRLEIIKEITKTTQQIVTDFKELENENAKLRIS